MPYLLDTWTYCSACDSTLTHGDYENGNYHECYDCGNIRCEDCGYYDCPCMSEDDPFCDCTDCRESRGEYDAERSNGVYNYSYKPTPMFKGAGPTFMGMELEVGGRASRIVQAVKAVDDEESHFYLKDDGSISGAEIVSHPMTLDYYRAYPIFDILNGLQARECRIPTTEYGLHVHVSRTAFNGYGTRYPLHCYRWLSFANRNKRALGEIGRRGTDNYWAPFEQWTPEDIKRRAFGPYGNDRRVAINCTPLHTIECRFPMATLDEVEVRATLELIAGTVEYTRQLRAADVARNALHWDAFSEWLCPTTYPNLSVINDGIV